MSNKIKCPTSKVTMQSYIKVKVFFNLFYQRGRIGLFSNIKEGVSRDQCRRGVKLRNVKT